MISHELKQGQTGTVESKGLTDRTGFVIEQVPGLYSEQIVTEKR